MVKPKFTLEGTTHSQKMTQTQVIKKIDQSIENQTLGEATIERIPPQTTSALYQIQTYLPQMPQSVLIKVDKFGTISFYEDVEKLAEQKPIADENTRRTLCNILNLPTVNAIEEDQSKAKKLNKYTKLLDRIYRNGNKYTQSTTEEQQAEKPSNISSYRR